MLSYQFTFIFLLQTTLVTVNGQNSYGNQMSSSQASNQQPMVANVQQQACGIPNGDSSFLTNLEQQMAARYRRSDHEDDAILEPRIIGGADAPGSSTSLCWEVSIYIRANGTGGFILCPGTIVGSQTVLTSALCPIAWNIPDGLPAYPIARGDEVNLTQNPVIVNVGVVSITTLDTGLLYPEKANCFKNYTVVKAVYKNLNVDTSDNGVGILILSEPIDFRTMGGCACKLCLSQRTPSVGDTCITSGYGDETNGAPLRPAVPLKYVKQKIQPLSSDPNVCYQVAVNVTAVVPIDRFYCAGGVGGEGLCTSDIGAPLFCYDPINKVQYLAGIAQDGASPCGSSIASRYTKVSLYLQWIFDNAPLGDISILN